MSRVEHKMGQRACPAAELTFDDVFVPDELVVGREGDGASATLIVLAASRPPVGAIATGIARGAYERLLAWLEDDPAAKGLLDRQHVQLALAEMEEEIHLARQAYMDAATELDSVALGATLSHPLVRALGHLPAGIRRRARRARPAHLRARARTRRSHLLHRTSSDRAMTRSVALSSMAKAHGADVAMRVTGAALELVGLRAGRCAARAREALPRCQAHADLRGHQPAQPAGGLPRSLPRRDASLPAAAASVPSRVAGRARSGLQA